MKKIIKKIKKWWKTNKAPAIVCVIFMPIGFLVLFLIINSAKLQLENQRLKHNQQALTQDIKVWKSEDSSSVAEIGTLKLTKDEFGKLYENYTKELKEMNIKLKRLLSYSQTSMSHNYTITDTIRDSVIIRENKIDTLTCVNYNDDYIHFNGCIDSGVFNGNIETFDTITSVVHIIPKKFLWFKYGVKRVDFTVKSRNPYSTIEDIKYIDINK